MLFDDKTLLQRTCLYMLSYDNAMRTINTIPTIVAVAMTDIVVANAFTTTLIKSINCSLVFTSLRGVFYSRILFFGNTVDSVHALTKIVEHINRIKTVLTGHVGLDLEPFNQLLG